MTTDIDYYDLLEATRDADGNVLKANYRRLAMQFHPDKNPGDAKAEARFKAISEAYDVLKDPQKRAPMTSSARQRSSRAAAVAAARASKASPIFSRIFSVSSWAVAVAAVVARSAAPTCAMILK